MSTADLPPEDRPPEGEQSIYMKLDTKTCLHCGRVSPNVLDNFIHVSVDHNDNAPETFMLMGTTASRNIGMSTDGVLELIELHMLLHYDACDCPDPECPNKTPGECVTTVVLPYEAARALGENLVRYASRNQTGLAPDTEEPTDG